MKLTLNYQSSKDPALRSWKVDPQALIMVGPWGLNRVTASCKKSGRMVLIEFRDTFHLPDDDHTKRLDNLCDMLSAMSNTRNPGSPKENPIDFRTLECRGWIAINSRIGLVFNYPSSHSQKRSAQEIISLRDRIICTYRSLNAPPLGARFALAAGLAQALATMCAVDWVHRDLRGDNVIFFDNSSIAAPFLTGFAYARPGYQSISPTTTSTHGSISPAKKRTDNKRLGKNYSELYRWEGYAAEFNKLQREESPDHTENVMRFNISVDTYALGVVLLEIGLWRTVDFRSRDGPNDDVLISKAETLAHTVGEIYAGVVERCLVEGGAAAWRDRTLEDSKALLVEVVQKLSKCRA